jgi:hypothetical protein
LYCLLCFGLLTGGVFYTDYGENELLTENLAWSYNCWEGSYGDWWNSNGRGSCSIELEVC